MKRSILLIALIALSSVSYSQQNEQVFPNSNLGCRIKGSMNFAGTRLMPLYQPYNEAGIENFNTFNFEGSFYKFYMGRFFVNHTVGFSLGYKDVQDRVKNIEFEGGYTGGLATQTTRTSLYGFSSIGIQPIKQLEISVFSGFSLRGIRRSADYFLYPGQVIAEEDLVSESDADDANSYKVGGGIHLGYKTGAEIVFAPNSTMSLFSRISFNYFGKGEVWDMSQVRVNTTSGEPWAPSTMVNNTSDWGITIGLRVNIWTGCTRTKRSGSSSSSNNSNNNNNNTNNSGNGGGVKLKPKTRIKN